MVFTYEHRVIIKYLRQKYGYGARKIVTDHPEFDWNEDGVKTLIKKIDETGSIERRKGSGRPKNSRTEENIDAVGERIVSQEGQPGTHRTPTEISAELGIPVTTVQRIVDEDLNLEPLKKRKVQLLSDQDIEKRLVRSKRLLRIYTRAVLETAFFSDEKIFKVRQQYNVQNDRVYVPKGTRKRDVDPERLLAERAGFPQQIMVSLAISRAGKSPIFFVEPGTKVNAQYYCDVLLKEMIPAMNRLAKRKEYLFMQDGARAHTAKITLGMLANQKYLNLLQPSDWPPNSPDLNPVDFCVWGILERNVYRGRKITSIEELKEAIVEEWAKISQDVIDSCIDAFRDRLNRVIKAEGRHIERY